MTFRHCNLVFITTMLYPLVIITDMTSQNCFPEGWTQYFCTISKTDWYQGSYATTLLVLLAYFIPKTFTENTNTQRIASGKVHLWRWFMSIYVYCPIKMSYPVHYQRLFKASLPDVSNLYPCIPWFFFENILKLKVKCEKRLQWAMWSFKRPYRILFSVVLLM
jgi:hypothetical protein